MTALEFARRLGRVLEQSDHHFAFFIGAGCSRSSGIPSARELVRDHWLAQLHDLKEPEETDLRAFARREFPDYDPEDPARIYGALVARLFLHPEEAQREIERLCQGKFPSVGYVALARLMDHHGGLFNVAITTNFDDLLQDALYLFTERRPLVVGHEALARYIRPTRSRPLVVKLHGDYRLAPCNTPDETERLQEQMEKEVRVLLHDRGLIFTGYGGHDKSVQRLLESLPAEALPMGVYWAGNDQPPEPLCGWLAKRGGVWVEQAGDFDELMVLLADALDVPLPQGRYFERFEAAYRRAFKELARRVKKRGRRDGVRAALERALGSRGRRSSKSE